MMNTNAAKGAKLIWSLIRWGSCLAVHVTPANEQERSQMATLAHAVQVVAGNHVKVTFVDQGYMGEQAEMDAAMQGIRMEVVKLPDAKWGFVLLPRRWVEHSFAWMAKFRCLVRDYEHLLETVEAQHFVTFARLMLHHIVPLLTQSA